jgi:hypothetical protein
MSRESHPLSELYVCLGTMGVSCMMANELRICIQPWSTGLTNETDKDIDLLSSVGESLRGRRIWSMHQGYGELETLGHIQYLDFD